jgi:hypothetical protein
MKLLPPDMCINLLSEKVRHLPVSIYPLCSIMISLLKPLSNLSLRSTTPALPILARHASTSTTPSSSSSLSSLPPLTPHNPIPRRQDYPSTHPGPLHKNINQPQWMATPPESQFPDRIGENEEGRREDVSQAITGMTRDELRGWRKYTVVMNRVVKMTKKGKMLVPIHYLSREKD